MKTQKSQIVKERMTDDSYPLIPTKDIQIVERPEPGDVNARLFYNPRSLESFTPDEMNSLMESLQEDGLQQPPIVRIFTKEQDKDGEIEKIELVAGERRLRSILRLIEMEAPCQTDDGELPASQVFAKIPCKVYYNITDEKALRIAFIENGQHQPLTTKEEIDLVERLTIRGLNQSEIAGILGTNVTWVSQTSNFREELPEGALERLLGNKMSRNVAVKLLSFKKEDRQSLFDEMLTVEEEDRKEAEKKLQAELEEAEDDEDLAESKAAETEDLGEAKKQTKKRTQARKRQEDITSKKKKLESDAGTLRQGHLHKAETRTGVSPKKAQILPKGMIQQFYVDLLETWLKKGKIDSVTKQDMPEDVLEVMLATAKAILTGQHDPGKVVREIMLKRGEWSMPADFEEEDDELNED